MELAEQVEVFRDMVDKEKVTIPRRSPKLATVEEAADAIRRIRKDYERQATIERQIALDHFDARRVLPPLLEAMGLN